VLALAQLAPAYLGAEAPDPMHLYLDGIGGGGWQRRAPMLGSNHDIMGAVLSGRVYIAGGFTATWGEPPRPHAYDELWCYEPSIDRWSVVVRLPEARIYCATVSFAGRIWILGGDVYAESGQRVASSKVEIFDSASGRLSAGPVLPFAYPAPLGLVSGGRLYILGQSDPKVPGRMDSIGVGESTWRREPDGPVGMNALAGAEFNGELYVCVPKLGLAVYSPSTRDWRVVGGPTQPRSPQVASCRDGLWIMGGRDLEDGTQTQIYQPATGIWRAGPRLPFPLSWGAAAVVADQIYIFGGASGVGSKVSPYVFSDQTLCWTPSLGHATEAISIGAR
jgi:hypothetical protein